MWILKIVYTTVWPLLRLRQEMVSSLLYLLMLPFCNQSFNFSPWNHIHTVWTFGAWLFSLTILHFQFIMIKSAVHFFLLLSSIPRYEYTKVYSCPSWKMSGLCPGWEITDHQYVCVNTFFLICVNTYMQETWDIWQIYV